MRPKPLYGTPCNRCGMCCVVSQCPISLLSFGEVQGRCPALEPDGLGGFLCGFAENAKGPFKEAVQLVIGVGRGCDAALTEEDYPARAKRRPDMIRAARDAESKLSAEARPIFYAWRKASAAGKPLPVETKTPPVAAGGASRSIALGAQGAGSLAGRRRRR